MGPYLLHPVTAKHSASGWEGDLNFGLSSMQGWRKGQEDAHCASTVAASTNGDDGLALFAVFDGQISSLLHADPLYSLLLNGSLFGTDHLCPLLLDGSLFGTGWRCVRCSLCGVRVGGRVW